MKSDYSISPKEIYLAFGEAVARAAIQRGPTAFTWKQRTYDLETLLVTAAFQSQNSEREIAFSSPATPSWIPDWRRRVPDWYLDESSRDYTFPDLNPSINGNNRLTVRLAYFGEIRHDVDNASRYKDIHLLRHDRKSVRARLEVAEAIDISMEVKRIPRQGEICCWPRTDMRFVEDGRLILLQPMPHEVGCFKIVGLVPYGLFYADKKLVFPKPEIRCMTIL